MLSLIQIEPILNKIRGTPNETLFNIKRFHQR